MNISQLYSLYNVAEHQVRGDRGREGGTTERGTQGREGGREGGKKGEVGQMEGSMEERKDR